MKVRITIPQILRDGHSCMILSVALGEWVEINLN